MNKQIIINETDHESTKEFKTLYFDMFGLMLIQMRKVDNNYKPKDNTIPAMIVDYLNTSPFCENEELFTAMSVLQERYMKNIEDLANRCKK